MNHYIALSFLLLVVVNVDWINSHNLPSYVIPCSRSDPKLNECATKVAKAGAREFSLGDESRGIPPLDPLKIKEIIAINSKGRDGLKVKLTDVVLTGPSKMEIKKIKIDYPKRKVAVKVAGDLFIESDYDMSGRLLIIPIVGNGKAHLKIKDIKIKYTFYYDIVKKEDGLEYGQFTNDTISYAVGGAHFQLDNLFNGDKVLGENTNRLLNDNWVDLINDLGPSVASALQKAVSVSVEAFLKLAPFDEIFLP